RPPIPVSKRTTPPSAATAQTFPCGTPGHGSGRRRRQTPGSILSVRGASGRFPLIERSSQARVGWAAMASADHSSQPRLRPRLREGEEEQVTPLELFFDLVF